MVACVCGGGRGGWVSARGMRKGVYTGYQAQAHNVVEQRRALRLVVARLHLRVQLVVDPHSVADVRRRARVAQALRLHGLHPQHRLAALVGLLDAIVARVALPNQHVDLRPVDVLDAVHHRLAGAEPVVQDRARNEHDRELCEAGVVHVVQLDETRVRVAQPVAQEGVVVVGEALPALAVAQEVKRRLDGHDGLAGSGAEIRNGPGGQGRPLERELHREGLLAGAVARDVRHGLSSDLALDEALLGKGLRHCDDREALLRKEHELLAPHRDAAEELVEVVQDVRRHHPVAIGFFGHVPRLLEDRRVLTIRRVHDLVDGELLVRLVFFHAQQVGHLVLVGLTRQVRPSLTAAAFPAADVVLVLVLVARRRHARLGSGVGLEELAQHLANPLAVCLVDLDHLGRGQSRHRSRLRRVLCRSTRALSRGLRDSWAGVYALTGARAGPRVSRYTLPRLGRPRGAVPRSPPPAARRLGGVANGSRASTENAAKP